MSQHITQQIEDRLRNDEYQNYFELQADIFKFREQFEAQVGKSRQTSRFLDGVCGGLYQSAAEKLSRRAAVHHQQENRRLELRAQQAEQEWAARRQEWEQER